MEATPIERDFPMRTFLQRHLSTVVVALVTAAVTASAPAVARTAGDADSVDGFSAVSCKAQMANRERVLVATCPNGYLPADIVKKIDDADHLDGIDSEGFYRAGATVTDSNHLGGFAANGLVRAAYAVSTSSATRVGKNGRVLGTTIETPGPGFILIHASSDTFNAKGHDLLACALQADGEEISSSRRWFVVDGERSDDDCATDGVIPITAAGQHTIDLMAIAVDKKKTTFGRTVIWALFEPFDGVGEQVRP